LKTYDLIVIGTGGGTKLVRPAAALGLKVAVVEKGRLGGTCLNHGCIPSKMLIHSADVMRTIEESNRFELDSGDTVYVDFEGLVSRVNETIDAESQSIEPLYKKDKNITLYKGAARFVGEKIVQVGRTRLTASKIFIAVGARPHIPSIPGLDQTPYMTYYEALRTRKLPRRLIVLGGGYIATELGYFFGMMGSEVDFIVRSQLLRLEDKTIRKEFDRVFSERFNVHKGVVPRQITHKRGQFCVELEEEKLKADALLLATGITPQTDQLDLDKTGVEVDKKGFIRVNDRLETTAPGIYSFGDCIGRHFFRHSANFEGEYLFNTLYGKKRRYPLEMPHVPHAVFSYPQVGSVGKREDDLKPGTYFVGEASYSKSAMGMALRSEEGIVKLIFERRTEKLIGAHIVGEDAATLIHMAIAYMQMHAKLCDLLSTIYIHPALAELIRNAARAAAAVRDELALSK
jgi:dihydrolipoamide dehydrogenase